MNNSQILGNLILIFAVFESSKINYARGLKPKSSKGFGCCGLGRREKRAGNGDWGEGSGGDK
jgi:hypothetical protein